MAASPSFVGGCQRLGGVLLWWRSWWGGLPLVTAAHAPAAACYEVTRTIPMGAQPSAVAVDPAVRTVYVATGRDTVSVIDAATNTVARTIPGGDHSWRVAVDPASRTVYVANAFAGTMSVIDAATSTVTATVPVGSYPWGVAVDPVTHTAYVASAGSHTVSVISRCT